MSTDPRFWLGVVGTFFLAIAPGDRSVAGAPSAESTAVKALAETIDRRLAEKMAESKVEPGPSADDAEFLRRVFLDLAGKIPSVAQTRDFLDDPAPEKRARLVDDLLASPSSANHATNLWRAVQLPENDAGGQVQFLAPDFEDWLRGKVARNAGLDAIARELVTLALVGETNGRRGINPFDRRDGQSTPLAYRVASAGDSRCSALFGFVSYTMENEGVRPSRTGGTAGWFLRMDRNRDGDLSRREFLGPLDEFKRLDTDGVGLVDPREAGQAKWTSTGPG